MGLHITSLLKKRYRDKIRKQNFHKKKLELGKVIFVVDDLYYDKIKLKSSFRMVMVNQPSFENSRTYFQNQLKKFSFTLNIQSIFSLFVLFLFLWYYVSSNFRNFIDFILLNHPNKGELNNKCLQLILDTLDLDPNEDIGLALKLGSSEFKLINFF